MFIHWFPGHMAKAIKMMTEEISLVDSVIYVLDARAPLACLNYRFEPVIGNKPVIYVLNKCDLVTKEDAKAWKNYFFNNGHKCITTNCLSKADAPMIIKNLVELNDSLIEKYNRKGIKKTLRAMVIGVPNTGKSTLINSLIKTKKAQTGNKPGVTRAKQWVSIDDYIDLLDSPGVLYPDFEDQDKAVKLALIGCIKDEIVDSTELALKALDFLLDNYKDELAARYRLTLSGDETPLAVFTAIATKRGYIVHGGEVDEERAARAIISDFRKGSFGKIVLDKLEVE